MRPISPILAASRLVDPRRFLRTLNRFGLDAALVMGLWCAGIAHAESLDVGPAPLLAAAAAGLAYLGDRLLDARRFGSDPRAADRHRFARRHFAALGALWVAVAAGAIVFAAARLDETTWRRGLVMALAASLYLALGARAPRLVRGLFAREAAVGVFFAAGAAALLGTRGAEGGLALAYVAFGALCAADALVVGTAERVRDRALGEWSTPSRHPRIAAILPAVLVVAGLAFVVAGALARSGAPVIAAGGGLLGLAPLAARLRREDARAETLALLADPVAAAPALALLLVHGL
ncbi:MAG: hypothetical protein R3F20_05185 [Planctomycetota bacterium]